MAAPDYSKIWGSNSTLAKYEFAEADYLRGWEFIGSMPPARTMFDAWMRKADEKMRWLYDNAFSENSLGGFLFWRLPDTTYFVGEKRALQNGPLDIYIECTIAGRTSKEPMKKLPQSAAVGDSFTDGTVTWIVRQLVDAENAGIAILQRKHAYLVGDIAYSARLPSWARLECVKAGTTAAAEPAAFAQMSSGGVLITDGTAVWIVDDLRDGTPVGAVRGSLYLSAGYVKANGATVQRADYPRLVALADRHGLWTDDTTANAGLFGRGDGVATMVLPNWTDRMVQLAGDGAGASVAAGLPNITGRVIESYAGGFYFGRNDPPFYSKSTKNFPNQMNIINGNTSSSVYMDLSKANPIYGASETVQPPAIKLIPIIRY